MCMLKRSNCFRARIFIAPRKADQVLGHNGRVNRWRESCFKMRKSLWKFDVQQTLFNLCNKPSFCLSIYPFLHTEAAHGYERTWMLSMRGDVILFVLSYFYTVTVMPFPVQKILTQALPLQSSVKAMHALTPLPQSYEEQTEIRYDSREGSPMCNIWVQVNTGRKDLWRPP